MPCPSTSLALVKHITYIDFGRGTAEITFDVMKNIVYAVPINLVGAGKTYYVTQVASYNHNGLLALLIAHCSLLMKIFYS